MSEFQIPQLKEYYLQALPKRFRFVNWRFRYTYDLTHAQLSDMQFIKKNPVVADFETKRGAHKVGGGNSQKIFGMWKVTEPDGDVQYVKHAVFMESYVRVKGSRTLWRKKAPIRAAQFSVPALVHTQDGWFHYPAGFVLVETLSKTGMIDRYAMSEEEFRERYIPLVG